MLKSKHIPEGRECRHPLCSSICKKKKPPKARTPLKRTAIKRTYKPKNKDDELEDFFKECASIIAQHPYCSECFEYISSNLYRFATAHIFPKKTFKSIKSHPSNWIKLGVTCGCHEKSHRMDTFSKMKVFPIAVQKFRQFEHLITETHSYLDLFKKYAEQVK